MSLSFLAAFLQYEVNVGLASYMSLAALGFSGLLVLCGRRRGDRVQHILSGGGLWFAAMVFGEVVSYTSNDTYSVLYGIVFIGVFFCARLVVQEIGLPNVLRAYSQAGFVTAILILVSGRQALLASEPAGSLVALAPIPTCSPSFWRATYQSSCGERWRRRSAGASGR